ncbi:MAG: tRNA (N6-threonylcarbamoyladenosine(37)-N6)-methyltransferase TrmO [Spirochaetia bacterium]
MPLQDRKELAAMQEHKDICFRPIGYFRTPFSSPVGMPIQPAGARGVRGHVELIAEYQDGLKDLDGFSHVFVLYHLHEIGGYKLLTTPFLDVIPHGIFATRSPARPNPIGLSVLRVIGINDGKLELEDVDVLDGTPVLDIKPYVAEFDACDADRFGWFEGNSERAREHRADERFTT